MDDKPQVLIVENSDDTRGEMGEWLGDVGFEVLACPGPCAPSYTCIGGREAICPLPHAADLVVVDLRLASDTAMMGTPGWQLLLYYLGMGKRVVALVGDEDSVHPYSDENLVVLPRPVHRSALVSAVRKLAPKTWSLQKVDA